MQIPRNRVLLPTASEELRPLSTVKWVSRIRSGPSSIRLAFRGQQPWLMCWLQPYERPQARTSLNQHPRPGSTETVYDNKPLSHLSLESFVILAIVNWYTHCVSNSQSVVPRPAGSASSGYLIEVQILRLYPRCTESGTLKLLGSNLCYNKPPGWFWASQVVLVLKNLTANAEDMRHGFDPWVGKISWGEVSSMATHSSILAWRIAMDRGAWRTTVHRVAKSQTWLQPLSMHTHTRWF